jgi:zinc/manganese transport system substrate-binding protein
MIPLRRTAVLVLTAAIALAALSGCSSSSAASSGIAIVTSTDVYADIAHEIGGGAVSITAFITDASQDPHSYQATTRDQLALSRADIVIENGGGYDDFMDSMLKATHHHAKVLNVVDISGKSAPAGTDLNEHLWYDLPTVARVVDTLVTALVNALPSHAAGFRANATRFLDSLHALQAQEGAIKAEDGGAGVGITEPVPLYLLQACGLVNRTPRAFSTAVEDGTDVPASVLKQTLELYSQDRVRALVYNAQTTGPETTQVIAAAHRASIPVVPVTETLPAGATYVTWMRANLSALRSALAS